jgi:protein-L-isoaspartate(D-aspartate) O-methyltransferase
MAEGAAQRPDYAAQREAMVREQLAGRGISDARVLAVMQRTPRHLFVPPEQAAQAYDDHPLPIAAGQTISQPYIVAFMLQALSLRGDECVLEIGTGSGYQTALLAALCAHVVTVERHRALIIEAQRALAAIGVGNVSFYEGDGSFGVPSHAPYTAIIAAAAAPRVPPPLAAQLADGGRLVLPVARLGAEGGQDLLRVRRQGRRWRTERLASVMFVPLVGGHGYPARD